MKRAQELLLNLLASLLLGGAGVVLMLFPAGSPGLRPALMAVGFVSFLNALSLQIACIQDISATKAGWIRFISMLLLVICGGIYWQNARIIEAMVFLITGAMMLAALLSRRFEFLQGALSTANFSIIGFSSGIILAMSRTESAPPANFDAIPWLAAAFLVCAFLGAAALIVPSSKYRNMMTRLQIAPWVFWLFVFPPSLDGIHFIPPLAVILAMLVDDLLPWHLLRLAEGDILSRRVALVAATIEAALLAFLGILLMFAEHSPGVGGRFLNDFRKAAFGFFTLLTIVVYYEVITVITTVNGLMQELARTSEAPGEEPEGERGSAWNTRLARYLKPFLLTHEAIRFRVNAQTDQINTLLRQLSNEKKRNAQLILLMELSQQLENQLDQPVAAQLAVSTLERAVQCSLAAIYVHDPEQKEFMLLAAAGPQADLIPPGYRQGASHGVIGRAVRQRKTQIINDTRNDPAYIRFENETSLSALVIPLIFNGHIHGMIALSSESPNAFGSIEIGIAEAIAAELARSWERSDYQQRLTNLIQAGSQLSSMVAPATTAQDVAATAREILDARFIYVHIQLGQERNFTQNAFSGNTSSLLASLQNSPVSEEFIASAFRAVQPFRVRDVRKYPKTAHLTLDDARLRSMLVIPIRWHHMNIGVILAFGKQREAFFTENDESLAELLSIQAAGAFESAWLQQELRGSLRITSLLYRLSNQIIQAENLRDAAHDIAQTAHKLANNTLTGIVLLDHDGSIAADSVIDAAGEKVQAEHPIDLIRDAMASGQMIYLSQGRSEMRTCMPIQTPIRKYGAIWMDSPEEPSRKPATNPNDLQALVNQAAIVLERSMLLVESRKQALEIKAAYDTLEATYDQTLASLISALDARDRETEGHSLRVSKLAVRLGETLGFSHEQLKVLERGSILHDIGKIGISDTILHKPGPLTAEQWKIMKRHPDIGAQIVEGIPFLEDTIPLIRHHQERWDGSGYPDGLAGEQIPLLARLFAVVDAFDALTSNRPYRSKQSEEEALAYIHAHAGSLFDPAIVQAFEQMMKVVSEPASRR
jgi:putative nucleotidyltransferase with HDIG domain